MLAVALTALVLGARDASAGTSITFNPTFQPIPETLVAGANGGLKVHLVIDQPDANFSAVITFLPRETGFGNCPANSPATADRSCADTPVPDGAIVGKVTSDSTLGLLNAPCNDVITGITFHMMDATTDMSQTVSFEDDPADPGKQGEQFEDDNGDGVPNGAQMYPTYLTRLIYGPYIYGVPGSAPLQPIQRSYGQTVVAETDVSLTLLVMQPGISINGLQLDPADGFPVITVLQNTGDPGAVPVPGSITDFCAKLVSDAETYGITRDNPVTPLNEGGHIYATNPAPGDYPVSALLFSERDDDNDGIENQLDPCPNEGNPDGWDPRMNNSPGDADHDGLPDVCDPNDSDGNTDYDGDGFLNRGDNCPVFNNPLQTDIDRDGIGEGPGCDTDDSWPAGLTGTIKAFPANYLTTGEATIGQVTIIPAKNGDSDCSGNVTAVDALFTLRYVASIEPIAPCVFVVGNANCEGNVNAVDALAMLRHVAGLPVNQHQPCTPLGDVIPS